MKSSAWRHLSQSPSSPERRQFDQQITFVCLAIFFFFFFFLLFKFTICKPKFAEAAAGRSRKLLCHRHQQAWTHRRATLKWLRNPAEGSSMGGGIGDHMLLWIFLRNVTPVVRLKLFFCSSLSHCDFKMGGQTFCPVGPQ